MEVNGSNPIVCVYVECEKEKEKEQKMCVQIVKINSRKLVFFRVVLYASPFVQIGLPIVLLFSKSQRKYT